MRQTTLSAHFPSIKSDLDLTSRKRKHKENEDEPIHPSKLLKFDSIPSTKVDPRICKSLNEDFSKSIIEPLQAIKLKPLLTPVSQIPNLSEKTQKVLEALIKKPYDRPIKEVDDVLGSVTAKEKYQDLLDPMRALALPYKYRRLMDLLEACDMSLNLEKTKKNQVSFEDLKRAVFEGHRLKLDFKNLQQMMYVMSEVYKLIWEKKNAKEYQLFIDFPDSIGKNEDHQISRDHMGIRKSVFRKCLIAITKEHHEAFLRSLPSRPHIDAEKLKTWHSSFDLHNTPDIPLKDLPDKPDQSYVPNISEIFNLGLSRNMLLETVFEGISDIKEVTIEPKPEESTVIKGLSSELSRKIKEKEAKLIEEKMQSENPAFKLKQAKIKRLINMCELIRALFSVHKTPSIFMNCLLKKASKAVRGISKENIEEDIREIIDLFPSWISMFKTNSGDVVRMNRKQETPMSEIMQEIHHKYS